MKIRMTRLAALAAAGVLAAFSTAWAQNTPTPDDQVPAYTMTTPGTYLSVGDRIFLMDLAHINARDIGLSRVAYHQANSPAVSEFAKTILRSDRKIQDQIMSTYGNDVFMKNWDGAMSHKNRPVNEGWVGGDLKESDNDNYNNWSYLYGGDWQDIHALRDMSSSMVNSTYAQDIAIDEDMLLKKIDRRQDETTNTDIKSLLSTLRPEVEHHLYMARNWRMDTASMNKFFYEN